MPLTKSQWDIALALAERVVGCLERWTDKEFPRHDGQAAEAESTIFLPGEPQPEPDSPEAYAALPTADDSPAGRFERKFSGSRTSSTT